MSLYSIFDHKRTFIILVVLAVILVVLTWMTWGEARIVAVRGTVWEWVNAPPGETGTIYTWEKSTKEAENWAPPPGMELQPLSSVYITYYAVYNEQAEKAFAISNKKGTFSQKTREWRVIGEITINLGAEKEGYQTVNGTFTNHSDFLLSSNTGVVHIIMVPE
ncbi:MAG: hypothetical protein MUO19_03900 [Dehalococcoidales bacterium]|nr:hypothetical protein [Dehalococcoidales bacterium]